MKITFIRHSCYMVELEKHVIVFDYIGGDLSLPEGKTSLFVVTHGHGDHFIPKIFDFHADYYLLSDDISVELPPYIISIAPDEEKTLGDFYVKTAGSTDLGISILVEAEGKKIFHSGDLNYWIWPRYSQEDIAHMEEWFHREVDKFRNISIDAVMMIVDPRLEKDYHLAGDYYMQALDGLHYFPMHMWEKYEIAEKFARHIGDTFPEKNFHIVEREGQEFSL